MVNMHCQQVTMHLNTVLLLFPQLHSYHITLSEYKGTPIDVRTNFFKMMISCVGSSTNPTTHFFSSTNKKNDNPLIQK